MTQDADRSQRPPIEVADGSGPIKAQAVLVVTQTANDICLMSFGEGLPLLAVNRIGEMVRKEIRDNPAFDFTQEDQDGGDNTDDTPGGV